MLRIDGRNVEPEAILTPRAREVLQYRAVEAPLRRLHYLGVLDSLVEQEASRLEFVLLACATAKAIKDTYPGLGLSSELHGKATGLDLIQVWIILLNAGHLFGTFATERAVLFRLHGDEGLRGDFVARCAASLGAGVEQILDDCRLGEFHYAMAALRVSQWTDQRLRPKAISLLKAYFNARGKARNSPEARALWVMKVAQQLAWTELNGRLGFGLQFGNLREYFVEQIVVPERFGGFSGGQSLGVLPVLDSVDRFHEASFFNGSTAAGLVLTHLREFNRWWRAQDVPPVARLELLWERPEDWCEDSEHDPIRHFVSLRLPPRGMFWLERIRRERERGEARRCWERANFIVTPEEGRGDQCRYDLYYEGAAPGPAALLTCAELLQEESTRADEGSRHFAMEFGLRLLGLAFVDDVSLSIKPDKSVDHRQAVALCRSKEEIRIVVTGRRRQLKGDSHKLRRGELQSILRCLSDEDLPDEQGVWVVFLSAVTWYRDEESNSDIDAVLGLVEQSAVTWWLMERKTGSGTGTKQVARLARQLVAGPESENVIGGGGVSTRVIRTVWR